MTYFFETKMVLAPLEGPITASVLWSFRGTINHSSITNKTIIGWEITRFPNFQIQTKEEQQAAQLEEPIILASILRLRGQFKIQGQVLQTILSLSKDMNTKNVCYWQFLHLTPTASLTKPLHKNEGQQCYCNPSNANYRNHCHPGISKQRNNWLFKGI